MHIIFDRNAFSKRSRFDFPINVYRSKRPSWHYAALSFGPLRFWVGKHPDDSKHFRYNIEFRFFFRIDISKQKHWERNDTL